jgi:hypothetical protein
MTKDAFITWLQGFVQAANPYNITPKQWEDLRDRLSQVNLHETGGYAATYPQQSTSPTSKILLKTEPNY